MSSTTFTFKTVNYLLQEVGLVIPLYYYDYFSIICLFLDFCIFFYNGCTEKCREAIASLIVGVVIFSYLRESHNLQKCFKSYTKSPYNVMSIQISRIYTPTLPVSMSFTAFYSLLNNYYNYHNKLGCSLPCERGQFFAY